MSELANLVNFGPSGMSMQQPQSLDQLPPLPSAPLQFGSIGDDVAALQSILVALGYLHCGPWHLARKTFGRRTYEAILRFQGEHGLSLSGFYDESTRAKLESKIKGCKDTSSNSSATSSQPANPVKEVEIVDTDGDVMHFRLSEDGGHVVEYVNGNLELDPVTYIQADESVGLIRDAKGSFKIKDEQRAAKLSELRDLLSCVGIQMSQIPPQAPTATVEIDLDLNASPEQMLHQERIASEAIRRACSSLGGVTHEAAQSMLTTLFEAITSAVNEPGGTPARTEDEIPKEVTSKISMMEEGVVNKKFEYEQELIDILEMGFDNVDRITALLLKHCGNICHVVTDLSDDRSV